MTKRDMLLKAMDLGAIITAQQDVTQNLTLNCDDVRDDDDDTNLQQEMSYTADDDDPTSEIYDFTIDVQDDNDHSDWEDLDEAGLIKVLPDVIKYLENRKH